MQNEIIMNNGRTDLEITRGSERKLKAMNSKPCLNIC